MQSVRVCISEGSACFWYRNENDRPIAPYLIILRAVFFFTRCSSKLYTLLLTLNVSVYCSAVMLDLCTSHTHTNTQQTISNMEISLWLMLENECKLGKMCKCFIVFTVEHRARARLNALLCDATAINSQMRCEHENERCENSVHIQRIKV